MEDTVQVARLMLNEPGFSIPPKTTCGDRLRSCALPRESMSGQPLGGEATVAPLFRPFSSEEQYIVLPIDRNVSPF